MFVWEVYSFVDLIDFFTWKIVFSVIGNFKLCFYRYEEVSCVTCFSLYNKYLIYQYRFIVEYVY